VRRRERRASYRHESPVPLAHGIVSRSGGMGLAHGVDAHFSFALCIDSAPDI